MLDSIVRWVEKYNRYPTQLELVKLGISRDAMRHHFGNIESLKLEINKHTDAVFDLESQRYNNTPKLNKKRFVITTAVTNAKVDESFYANLKLYCEKFDAQLLIMVSLDKGKTSQTLDPILREETIIVSDTKLNSNLFLLGIKNVSKTGDPVTGLPRIGRRNGTFIGASPKQRMKMVPTGQHKLPHALMSTGAITKPAYFHSRIMVEKSSYIAHSDHVMGAVIVEIENSDTFHYRPIQADRNGSFVDLGTLVRDGKFSEMIPEAMVLGDWHSGDTDPVAAKCWDDISTRLKVKRWIIHDGFDGKSVNHHDDGKLLTLAKKANDNKLILKNELDFFVEDIRKMSEKREVVIVKSNHDEFLERYLNEGRYVQHPHNHRIALDLAAAQLDGHNPVKYYFDSKVKRTANKVTWLERDESYKIAGIELGAHGDKGANGSRGSARSMENAYGPCVYGHTHTPEINREVWCVGTTSKLQLDYNVGPSSWFHTSCLIYSNGQRQMINCVEGRSTTRKL